MTSAIQSIVNMGEPFNMVVLVMVIVMAASIVKTIAKETRRFACHRQELELKRELLDRGMGAEEIERVVKARGPASESKN
jgi:cell division protein FtsL